MNTTNPLWRRLALFFLVPAIAAVSPLIVLPIVARAAGQAGWASAIAGESVGTVASIAIGYGWMSIGPALISISGTDSERGAIYRGSIVVRLIIAAIALPIMGVVCWLVADPGSVWLAVLMGLQGALIALSFTWFSAGMGEPHAIVFYDSIPRLVIAIACAVAILNGAAVELYPIAGIAVTLVGTGLFSRKVLRRYRSPWPSRHEVAGHFRVGAPVALNDVGLSVYSSVPTPLVTVIASPAAASGFASADKMLKLGLFIPATLANALQTWIAEAHGAGRSRRMRLAMLAHASLGVGGGAALGLLGAWASTILFGEAAAATTPVLLAMGLTFAFFSLRTSMTRHVLYPGGETVVVVRATLIATAIGVPVMIGLALLIGPAGAAVGFALTEGAATLLLWRRCAHTLRTLDRAAPITG